MTQYTLAPHWVKLEYLVLTDQHSMTFSVNVDNDTLGLTQYDLVLRDGISTVSMPAFHTAFLNVLAPLYNDTDTGFIQATLYRQLPTDVDPVILDVDTQIPSWTQVTNTKRASQTSFNFYDQQRKRLRLTLLDAIFEPFRRESYAGIGGISQLLVDYMLGADCPITTRAGGYIHTFGQRTVTYNDKLTQKYFNVK